ncbi:hypothetical protein MTYP_02447 [Methylophilaceae bacterium]|nr:hypothetical protein MTYP_02447 [Methylophilaceae bacterium]
MKTIAKTNGFLEVAVNVGVVLLMASAFLIY